MEITIQIERSFEHDEGFSVAAYSRSLSQSVNGSSGTNSAEALRDVLKDVATALAPEIAEKLFPQETAR